MRQAQKKINRGQVSRTISVSSPVAGWNARDPIAEMKEKDAVTLDNFFCTPFDVMLRHGYKQFSTGMTGQINSLMSYSPPSGAIKLFSAVGTKIYDSSSAGAVSAAVVSSLTSDKFQHVNFGTAGGNFLIAVNGADKLIGYTGSAWWKDGDGTHDITGIDSASLINVAAFAKRLWFCEKSSLKVWYLGVLAIGGAATSIDFSGLFNRGGYIMAMGDWSLDAGYGMDDYAVFVTSEGQVAVYKGTDPSSPSTWALIGVYDIGAPIGRRCMMKYAGDVTIICKDGLAPLSKSLMSSRVNSQEMLTDKIQHIMSDYTTSYGSNFGWETTLYPPENMLLVNVPTSSGTSYQLVMNTISGAWSRFKGWNTTCFELHGDRIYFGGNGFVAIAWETQADDGNNIAFEAQQSFNYFGRGGQLKQVKMLRPIISTDGNPALLFGVNTDFDTTAPTGLPTFTPSATATWDAGVWDGALTWAGDLSIKRDWQTAFGLGYSISAHMMGACKNVKLRWMATDYLMEGGGVV
jgi:hypothetical protein